MATREELFNEFVDTHLAFYRQLSLRIVNSAADADDAVQQALVKAWFRRSMLRREDAFAGWVAKIVIRESYDLLRRRRRADRFADGDAASFLNGEPLEETMLYRLDSAVEALPEPYRRTAHLGLFGNLDAAAAAKLLGCSKNTFYQRIHRVKELIRERLEEFTQ